MLTSTFCHLPRIGTTTEKNIWKQGIKHWGDFIQAKDVKGVSRRMKPFLDRELRKASKALMDGNSNYFQRIPNREKWRLYSEFAEEACYLDIETNWNGEITVLGVSNGIDVWQFVRGVNMNKTAIEKLLRNFKIVLTFNGASFDLPIVRRYFGNVVTMPHIDLRHAGARVGLHGGLKLVEQELGIQRAEHVKDVRGDEALRLWEAYKRTGEEQYRDILMDYNAEDIVNLKPLAEIIYDRLVVNLR